MGQTKLNYDQWIINVAINVALSFLPNNSFINYD